METMKAIVKHKPEEGKEWKRGLSLVDRRVPEIQRPEEVKVQVVATSICGTDVGIYNSKDSLREEMKRLPTDSVVIGHEFCGKIIDAGPVARNFLSRWLVEGHYGEDRDADLRNFVKGRSAEEIEKDRDFLSLLREKLDVSAEMHITCGRCYQCRLGERHVCQNTKIKGIQEDGTFTRYVVLPVQNLVLFRAGELPVEIIAFMDALGNAVHTAQSVNLMGQTVAILGCGVQGLLATAVARFSGASKIFVTDASSTERGIRSETVQEKRFGLARKLGAHFCFDVGLPLQREALVKKVMEETDGTGVDVVFEMSGSYQAYEDAFKVVRMGGTISLLGIPEGKMSLDFANAVVFRGVTIHGIIGRRVFSTWEAMKSLLKAGLSDLLIENHFISHDLPLTQFEEGFRAMMSGEGFKVVFRPV